MKITILLHLNRNKKGFTLIEAIVSLFLISVIGLGAGMANVQVLNQTSRNSDYTIADRQTLNAAHWITSDVQMAQTIQTGGVSGFPLTLRWVEWDSTAHQVVYSLEDTRLIRSENVTGGSQPKVMLVADYINTETDMTNCVSDNGVLTLTVTGSVGQGTRTINVTKIHRITSRPNL